MKKILLICFVLMFSQWIWGKETRLVVRVKAHDAKFVGSSLGGAFVAIKDHQTGVLLASGLTKGSTGNTGLIMKTPRERGMPIADDQTAAFRASLDIEEPVFVTIEVTSPANLKQAQVVSSTQLWLIPGKHIEGDGVVLVVPGFIIDILKPRTHHYIALKDVQKEPFLLRANIVMMCGCTIERGGLWNADSMEVKALHKNYHYYPGILRVCLIRFQTLI